MARTLTGHSGQSPRRTGAGALGRALIAVGVAAPILLSTSSAWAAPLPPAPTSTPAPAAGSTVSGVPVNANFHGMWSTYTDAQRAAVLDSLRWAGSTSVRIDVSWGMLQPTSRTSYDPWGVAFVDRVIAMTNQRGMKPLIMLWMTPGWANGRTGDRTLPTNPADYARVATFAATKWRGKVAGWEVWNEPNSPGYMTGADPVAYTRLLKAAYPAFKAGDPTTPVITGGVEYNDTDWLTRMYNAGAKGSFDAIATHPYMGVADADPATPDDGTKWTLTHAAAVHRLMVARGDGAKKLWFTEFGWSSHATAAGAPNYLRGVTPAVQSAYLVKTAALVRTQMPYVQAMYWYADHDESTGNIQYDNYGLFGENLGAKPVFTGLRTANV
jgi:hypothetical protein